MRKESKQKLFSVTKKDFVIEAFSGSGAGGQHRNRHPNCVRIKHVESGVIKTCTKHRSLHQNQQEAFVNLAKDPKFKLWLNRKAAGTLEIESQVDQAVKAAMVPGNLKVEGYDKKKDGWEAI